MLSKVLINKRIKNGLTRYRVWELSGISLKEYELMENGIIRKMSIDTYNELKDILGLDKIIYNRYVSPYKDLRVLRIIRNTLGYSLDDVSEKTGIFRMQIWRMEKGQTKKVSKEVFDKLAKVYNIKDIENYDHLVIHPSYKMKFKNPSKFSEEVHIKRKRLRLSQEMLGFIADVDFTLISKIESKSKSVTVDTALKIMNALDFTDKEKKEFILIK